MNRSARPLQSFGKLRLRKAVAYAVRNAGKPSVELVLSVATAIGVDIHFKVSRYCGRWVRWSIRLVNLKPAKVRAELLGAIF